MLGIVLGITTHSVAIDKSQEMLINKDCKTSIVRPRTHSVNAHVYDLPPDYFHRIAHYMPYRSKSVKNIQLQLFPTKKDQLK